MTLAVDIKDGRGPSNEVRHQLQLKKAVKIAAKGIYAPFITSKTKLSPCH